jgi:CNT family concentrative nucleoside transporter
MDIVRGLIGILFLVAISWVFSSNRKAINWPLVIKGIALQLILAVLVLKVDFVAVIFDYLGKGFVKVIGFTDFGSNFLLRSFTDGQVAPGLLNFAFKILPTIVFFSALTALLYHLRILQLVVYAFAWVMKYTLKLSGAESLAAAGNIFLGQTETPLLIKPYLQGMTKSEILCLMTGGMATIAGGVLASYINFLGGDDPASRLAFAKHLLTASIMSAPAAIVAAKMLFPETEQFNKDMKLSNEGNGANALEAIANGTSDGLKLAVNVGGMLLVFTAFIYMGNWILSDLIGRFTGLNDIIAANTGYDSLSFQFILGYIGAPIAWLMGVCSADILAVGQLIGEKTILNEFYAYVTLGEMKNAATVVPGGIGIFHEEKSMILATYILCGFSNFASIGIQIGGIGTLIPTRKSLLSTLGFRALLGGTIACLFTAAVVGIFL